jgi:putative SOS response-associated peptidase YedK
MPVMLMTRVDVERWLSGTMDEALELQKPAPDEAIMVQPLEKKAVSSAAPIRSARLATLPRPGSVHLRTQRPALSDH